MRGKSYGLVRATTSVAVIALVSCFSISAQAQEAGVASEQGDNETIIVTGSRIKRPADFDTSSPLVAISAQSIEQSGTTNLTDYLSSFPALQGSSIGADNAGDRASIGATGLNLLDLRNLGPQRTLVLINGRRHVSSVAGEGSVDINTIPTDLIDRVDVLTGGESAVYGADAVSGVVNFVLKDNFEGLITRMQAGVSRYGDAGQRQISLTGGVNFGAGRGNFAFSYEHSEEDRLSQHQRDSLNGTKQVGFYLNPDDPENQGGYDGPSDNGVPDYVPLNNVRYFDTNREGGIDVDFDGFPDYLVGKGGALTRFDPGVFVPNTFQQGGNATLASDYGNDLLPNVKRDIFNAIGHYDFTPALTLFAEGKYARTQSYSVGQPSWDYYLSVKPDNPFLPAGALAANQDATASGICDDPDTPELEECPILLNRDNFDFGRRGENIDRQTFRVVVGAKGEISSHATYELSYNWGRTDVTNHYVNDVLSDRFYAAIDVVKDPATGNPTCRVNLDPNWQPDEPFTYVRPIISPTTFQPGECVPLNLFGDGAPSQAALNFIHADTTDTLRIEQHVVSGSISGDFGAFFSLPGGPVGFAVGGEYRKETSQFTADALAQQGLTSINVLSNDGGSYDVFEGFGELRAPLLRDVPLAYRLELGSAIRFSDYSTIGSTTTWKVDGTYAPIRDITFNATYSKAVRAPNINELFSGDSQTYAFLTDPCDPKQIQNGTQYRAANCQALLTSLGADPADYTDTRSSSLPGLLAGNANLSAEEATTWTAGIILEPRFIRGLSIRADWYDIKIANAINTASATELARLCVDQPTLDNQYCASIERQDGADGDADAGNVIGYTLRPFNVADFHTAGLDVTISYRLQTAKAGAFSLLVRGNYLDKLTFISSPGADLTDHRGEADYRSPKYTVNGDLTWTKGAVTLNYGLLWFDKTLRFSNQETNANTDIIAPEYKYVKARWQHDVYGAVKVKNGFEFYGGVTNLFDQKPDIGTIVYPVNSIGRRYFVGVKAALDSLF